MKKFSDEELISGLKKLSKELGRSPKASDCKNCSYIPSYAVYARRFGSWNEAKRKAGLLESNKISNEELLDTLSRLSETLGYIPTQKECKEDPHCASPATYIRRFGSWDNAISNLTVPKKVRKHKPVKVDLEAIRADILRKIFDFTKEHGRHPKTCEFKNMHNLPSGTTVRKYFGSIQEAVELSGAEYNPFKGMIIQKDDLITGLQKFYKENGKAPSTQEMQHTNYLHHCSTYARKFGSYSEALIASDIPLPERNYCSQKELEVKDFICQYFEAEGSVNLLPQNREIDIFVPEKSFGVEFDGLYWHCDEFKDRTYHLNKTKDAQKKNIQLVHIFENEWDLKQDIVKSRLKSLLGVSDRRIFARNTEVQEISTSQAREFLDTNHIQGYAPASIKLGLFLDKELVAVQTFCKARFTKDCEYELLRFCSALNTNVIGGASKLFKHFVLRYSPESVVSYCDLRWGGGKLYEHLGFRFSHCSQPNFWYFKHNSNILESRVKYQKHKLRNLLEDFDPNKTAEENMKMNGYRRIFDCGNKVFKWTPENKTKEK